VTFSGTVNVFITYPSEKSVNQDANGNVTLPAGLTVTNDASISGLTVGKGGGSVSSNTAVGSSALSANTTGTNNTAVGLSALQANTTGGSNTAVGLTALSANTTGSYNDAYGLQSLTANTTGNNNTGFGYATLYSNTTGAYNTAVGGYNPSSPSALFSNTTGSYNIAVGNGALKSNTTASNNTAVGYQAGYSNTTGAYNAYFGVGTGYTATVANDNAYFGWAAGNLATGSSNTFIGDSAGKNITTGQSNTLLGRYNGNQGGLDIRTASNYIVLSDGDGNPRLVSNSIGQWGVKAAPYAWSSSYTVMEVGSGAIYSAGSELSMAGNTYFNGSTWVAKTTNGASLTVNGTTIATYTAASVTAGSNYSLIAGPYVANTGTSWTNSSDERLKNVNGEIQNGLSKVCSLRAAEFSWKSDATNKPCVGLIAQDVEKVLPEVVNAFAYVMGDETEYLGIQYTDTIPLLVAAIKELKLIVDEQNAKVTALEAQLGAK